MASRRVLYSPGYGAGWVSWHGGTREQKQWMLTCPIIIAALDSGWRPTDAESDPVVAAFLADWAERFHGTEPPYLGGLRSICVADVDGDVRIDEYDGHESVSERESNGDEWL